jgi:hypothetical protein
MYKTILFVSLFLIFSLSLFAQNEVRELTDKERTTVIDSISKLLRVNYVFPEVADKMAIHIKSNLKNGLYQSIIRPQEYAIKLTQDLQSISNDKHLRVIFNPQGIRQQKDAVTPSDSIAFINNYIEKLRGNNFGFKEVKILEGNIGYVDLRSFTDTLYAGKTAVAAMNFVSNSDALIVDLRNNGGGSPSMIQLITSYFYSTKPVHLNSFYWRPTNENTQTWTLSHVPGKRRPDIDLYILTSSSTFSAAEEFAYNLKNLKRATLIGETTGGGAHPGGTKIATERFMVWIPSGRAINPITKTNWEGVGVEPHIKTTLGVALNTARIMALEKLKKQCKDENRKQYYDSQILSLKVVKDPILTDSKKLPEYVGKYGPAEITFNDGKLYYQRNDSKCELISLGQDLFGVAEFPSLRIEFVKRNNTVYALKLFENGNIDEFIKEK